MGYGSHPPTDWIGVDVPYTVDWVSLDLYHRRRGRRRRRRLVLVEKAIF